MSHHSIHLVHFVRALLRTPHHHANTVDKLLIMILSPQPQHAGNMLFVVHRYKFDPEAAFEIIP